MENDCYGEAFGKRAGLKTSPVFVSRALNTAEIAITETASSGPTFELSEPHPAIDAFLLSANIIDLPAYRLWENGRPVDTPPLLAGETEIFDLKATPVVYLNGPLHTLHFFLPRSALDEIADNAGVPRIEGLMRRGDRNDLAVRYLALALLPAMRHPDQVSRLFVEQIALAVGTHAALNYGGMRAARHVPGGLAPWQERRAFEFLDANIDGAVSLSELARECCLSNSQFARAFRTSTGLTPHQWLLRRRIDRAKAMLQSAGPTLTEVALACGFADQSHFTRTFSTIVGATPGAWRHTTRA